MAEGLSEDDFLHVLDEMTRLCGDQDDSGIQSVDHEDLSSTNCFVGISPSPPSSSRPPLIGDQLLSSTSSRISKRLMYDSNPRSDPKISDDPPRKRSRNSSANSGMSNVSYDSAIADIFFAATPHNTLDIDRELMDFTSTSNGDELATTFNDAIAPSEGKQGYDLCNFEVIFSDMAEERNFENNSSVEKGSDPEVIARRDPFPEASETLHDHAPNDEGPHREPANVSSNLQLNNSDLDFVFMNPSPLMDHLRPGMRVPTPSPLPATLQNRDLVDKIFCPIPSPVSRPSPPRTVRSQSVAQQYVGPHPHRSSSARSQSRQQNRPLRSTSTRPDFQSTVQHEIEMLCRDLLLRYRDANQMRPPLAGIIGEDPLQTATRLLKDSLLRLRHFLDSLESFNWLTIHDRNLLYSSHVCSLAVLKASSSVKMDLVPIAYPLPYGENLEEVEALHLILAHDLYNELRSLLGIVKNLSITDFSVMLLVMMVTLFRVQPGLQHPARVAKLNDFFMYKLQMYLIFRYGDSNMPTVMATILSAIERIRNFSLRFREFMSEVLRTGLQNQYEAVCENVGLMAFLLHTEPCLSR